MSYKSSPISNASKRPHKQGFCHQRWPLPSEDFTSIILGTIPPLYDTYIAAITVTSTLLNQVLTPTNFIDTTSNEADCRTIKNPKSKKDEYDTIFVAGQSKKGGGSGSKKSNKDVECFNCHNKGHFK